MRTPLNKVKQIETIEIKTKMTKKTKPIRKRNPENLLVITIEEKSP